jgi:hypothetical protein
MKKYLLILFIVVGFSTPAWAANKYAVGTGDWNSATLWKTTSGGATAAAQPTTSDVCYLDANTTAVTVNATDCVCQQVNMTNFAGTLTISGGNRVTISTNVTLSSAATYAGDGSGQFALGTTGAGTINLGGVTTLPYILVGAGTGTKTFNGNLTVGAIVHTSNPKWAGAYKITTAGGLNSDGASQRTHYGAMEIELTGGVWGKVTKRTEGKVILNGNVTLTGGISKSDAPGTYNADLEYVSGTITATGVLGTGGTSKWKLGSNCHIDDIDGSGTLVLLDDLYVDGTLQSAGTENLTINGSGGNRTIYVAENLITYNLGTFINADGTAKIVMAGTGTFQRATALNGMTFQPLSAMQIDVDINTSGTITFNNGIANKFGGGRTLTYVAGTVVTTGCTWDVMTGGYTFNIDTLVPTFEIITAGATATLSSDFDCTTYRQIAGSTLSIATTKTFTVGTNFYVNGTDSATTTISSAGTGLLDYNGTTANQKIFKCTFTNIDASPSAVPIYSWYGTVTGSTNVYAITGANIKPYAVATA